MADRPATERRLNLELLGGLRVALDELPVTFRHRKSAALVAYLATEGRPVPRATLCALLWADMPEGRALANLRTVLHDLRRALPGVVAAEGDHLAFSPTGPVMVDRDAFEATVAACATPTTDNSPGASTAEPDPGGRAIRAAAALERYTGPFLEGFHLDGAPEFEDFVTLERQRLQQEAEKLADLIAADRLIGSRVTRTTVPVPASALIGREEELTEVERLLADGGRLVSVIGPGGVGKTRLTQEVLRRADGAGWAAAVDLSGLEDPEGLPAAIAGGLGLPLVGLRPPLDELVAGLARVDGLLLLDNVEQLLPEATDTLATLVKQCRWLRLLVTSRVRLRMQAEQVVALRPFDVPDPEADPAVLAGNPAVRLFVARARSAGAADGLEDLPPIARICAFLDGLPLAIELAAARCRLLSPAQALAGLRSILDPVGGSPRDLPGRQRTLRDSLDWSYRLLGPEARTMLRCLGAFHGGAPLGALVSVGAVGDDEGVGAVLELVDAGLAERSAAPAGTRLAVMESTRAFAAELLDADPDADDVRRRHALAYRDFARSGRRGLQGRAQGQWVERFRIESDNLRAALSYALAAGDPELATELASCTARYWHLGGHLTEGRDWLERCLALEGPGGRLADLRGQARLDLVLLALLQEPADRLRPLLDRAEADFTLADDRSGVAMVAYFRGMLLNGRDPSVSAEAVAEAEAGLREALDVFCSSGDRWNAARVRWLQAHYTLTDGDLADALALAAESERGFEEVGDLLSVAMVRALRGILVGLSEGYASAEPLLTAAFDVQRRGGDVIHASHTLAALACMRAGLQQPDEAARLFGAYAAITDRAGIQLPPAYEPLTELHRQMAREATPPDRWEAAYRRGYAAGFDVDLCEPNPRLEPEVGCELDLSSP